MSKRTRIRKYYVTRDKNGRFKKWVAIGASLQADKRKKSRKKIKSGYGNKGDQ